MSRVTGISLGIALLLTATAGRADEPTSAYLPREVAGWTLLIHPRLAAEQPDRLERTVAEVQRQLDAIVATVPAPAVEQLRRVRIWIELDDPRFPCMCYHGHEGWLREHGVNTDKTGDVELANPRNFLVWVRQQPWMVFHELAHAYHARFLPDGFKNARIADALAAAKAEGRYGPVAHAAGGTRDHYAATNPMEYFAEGSEAYFGRNDFFPFDQAELKTYDPRLFALLTDLWGVPAEETP